MKKIITILALIVSFSAFADSVTNCWKDSQGHIHCTTTERPSGSIAPQIGW